MLQSLFELFERISEENKWFVVLIGYVNVMILAILDLLTGFEYSFALFYLMPVSLVSWFGGNLAGIFVAITSAAAWQISNIIAGETFSNPLIPFWNFGVRLGIFIVVVILLGKLRDTLKNEQELSRTDYLTGSLNRRAFNDILELEILRTKRYQTVFSIAFIDIDNFKSVNDAFGHSTGDHLLRTVAEDIHNNLRSTDSVARLGGDEFALLMLGSELETTRTTLSRLQQSLQFKMEQNHWPVTFSMGGLVVTQHPESAEELIQRADHLMYSVKNNGKNAVICSEYERIVKT